MLRLSGISLLVAALMMPVTGATAQDEETDALSVFGAFGFTRVMPSPGKPCIVESTISEDDFIKAIPALQKVGVLNPEMTQTEIITKPHVLEATFATEMAPAVTIDLFNKNESVGTCQFRQMLSDVDNYGTDRKRLVLSYRFDRTTYKRIKWDKFKWINFSAIAPEFKYEPWFFQVIRAEADK